MTDPRLFYHQSTQSLRRLRGRVGGNVHELRRARGMDLSRLSRLSGLPVDALDHIELGKGNIDMLALVRVAMVLRVDVMDLFLLPVRPEG